MGSFGGYNEKKRKKKKQTQGAGQPFSSAPVFIAPRIIKKERKEK